VRAFKNAFSIILKRPYVIFVFAVTVGTLWLVTKPFLSLLLGLSALGQESGLSGLVSLLQLLLNLLTDTRLLLYTVLALAVILLAASAFTGLILSGCFNSIKHVLEESQEIRGDFIDGVRKYFFRIFLVSIKSFSLTFFLMLSVSVICVPALVVSKAAFSGRNELLAMAVFLDVITAGVVYIGFMFFRIYIFFWYPAAISHEKKPFAMAKQAADKGFWKVAGGILTFDMALTVFQIFMIKLGYKSAVISSISPVNDVSAYMSQAYYTFLLVMNGIFLTFFLVLLAGYIFAAFRALDVSPETK